MQNSIEPASRRTFLKQGLAAAVAAGSPQVLGALRAGEPMDKKYDISLAAWSVHRMVHSGKLKQIDMPRLCRKEFDISGLELVNSFFVSPQYRYLRDLNKRAADQGVKVLLIMCDGEGDMSHADKKMRMLASRNHRKWIDIAAVLGCQSIRCNSGGVAGDAE